MFLQGFGRKISRLGAEATNLLRESFQGMPMDLWEEFTQERKCLPQLLNISDHFRTKGLKLYFRLLTIQLKTRLLMSDAPLMFFLFFRATAPVEGGHNIFPQVKLANILPAWSYTSALTSFQ